MSSKGSLRNCSFSSTTRSESESDDNCNEWQEMSCSPDCSQLAIKLNQINNEFPRFGISSPQSDTNSINNLDDYSLYLIFSKLTFIEKLNAQKVCNKWKQLIMKLIGSQTSIGVLISCAVCQDIKHQVSNHECIGDIFDSAVEVNTKWYFVNASNLSLVLTKCPNLKSLILQNCIFCREVLEIFGKYCSGKLEHLDLSNSSCNINEILQIVSEKCSHTLKHVMLKDNEINESGLKSLINSCQNLEVLILDRNEDIIGECFDLLGDKISYLSIADCKSIDDEGINALVSGNGKRLTHLKVGNTTKPSMLRLICENMSQLQYLEFDGFKTESANAYNCVSLLTSLQELILTLPRIAFDTQLIDILQKCRHLKKVKIDGAIVTNASLKQFRNNCPSIEQISIAPPVSHSNSSITDESRFELGSLTSLRSLSICGSAITDELVRTVCFCPRLVFIELDDCKLITYKSLDYCIQMAKSRPNDKIMLFVQRTHIQKPLIEIPSNLSVFGSWTI